MKPTPAILLIILVSCNALPQLYQTAESISNDDAIDIMVSREAINKNTDLNIFVELKNSEKN